jgi:hypothetical protein
MEVAVTGSGGRAGFWSVITWKGAGCFRIYSENTNSDVYCDILDNYLVPIVQLYGLEDNFIFQHDNTRFHTLKETQAKLQKLHTKVL